MRILWMRLWNHLLALAPQRTYVVLHQVDRESPSETVVVWQAYEAAPQEARSAREAVASFQRESLLTGTFLAIRQSDYQIEVTKPDEQPIELPDQ